METSLNNYNKSNGPQLRPQTVPTWIRHLVANRLAVTPSEWISLFLQFRSGTHNNQWLVVDLGRYKRSSRTEILMVEEAFDIYAVSNFTDRFYKDGYVASYNVPYDEGIYAKMNYTACTIVVT